MIYIYTRTGWFSTGKTELGQIPRHWSRYARIFYDTDINDFCRPGFNGHYMSRGFKQSELVKLKMWLSDEAYPLFNENTQLAKLGVWPDE